MGSFLHHSSLKERVISPLHYMERYLTHTPYLIYTVHTSVSAFGPLSAHTMPIMHLTVVLASGLLYAYTEPTVCMPYFLLTHTMQHRCLSMSQAWRWGRNDNSKDTFGDGCYPQKMDLKYSQQQENSNDTLERWIWHWFNRKEDSNDTFRYRERDFRSSQPTTCTTWTWSFTFLYLHIYVFFAIHLHMSSFLLLYDLHVFSSHPMILTYISTYHI